MKRIDLQPLYQTVNVLSSLVSRYNETCHETGRHSSNSSRHDQFLRIPGERMTVFKGLKTCKSLGIQLLELRSKEDVSEFLSQTPRKDFESPAAGYYNTALRTYVFFSDNLPLKEFSAIKLTPTGSHVADYDIFDSYETYFTRYLIRGTHISLQFVPSSSEYDHVYCKRKQLPAKKDSRTCKKI